MLQERCYIMEERGYMTKFNLVANTHFAWTNINAGQTHHIDVTVCNALNVMQDTPILTMAMSNPGISVNTLHRYAKYSRQMRNMLHLVTVTWVHTNMPTKNI